MPLSAESFIQENSGTAINTGSIVVSLPAGTTVENTVVVILSGTAAETATGPAGFTKDKTAGSVEGISAWRKPDVAAGETSWTFTSAASQHHTWYVAELSGVDPAEPLDASANSGSTPINVGNGGTLSSGTAPMNAALNTVVIVAFAAKQTDVGDVQSWSGYTNEFEEVLDINSGVSGGIQLAVARRFPQGTTGQFQTTATLATSIAGTTGTWGLVLVYRAADSPLVEPLGMLLGFEWGTHGGAFSHNGSTNMFSTGLVGNTAWWDVNFKIQAASARNGSYGLRVTQTGAQAYVHTGSTSTRTKSVGFNVRVVSATGTVVVAGAGGCHLVYDSVTNKLGVRWGSAGAVTWQSGTTALNTWVWVDLRVNQSTSTHRADWRIETAADTYTSQTSIELTGQTPTNWSSVSLGGTLAQTATFDFDDVVISNYASPYPLGPHKVVLLKVDPAGTPSVSGTSSNFSVFTANGTLGAWNAANARDAVDDVPPTISASADGVCQTATASGDYMEFPMQTYTCPASEVIAGVRMLAPMWGGTGAGTGTVGIRGNDGTSEVTLIANTESWDPGSLTTPSATVPPWRCAMWPTANGWTQAKLDAAAVRVGFSTDATPDMGVHVVYLEAAIGNAQTEVLFGEPGSVYVEGYRNPNSYGLAGFKVSVPADRGATVQYEVDGVPQTPVMVAAGGSPVTKLLQAPAFDTINIVRLEPGEPT